MKKVVIIVGGFRLPDGNASAIRSRGNADLFGELGYTPVIVGKIDPRYMIQGQKWYRFFGLDCLNIECSEKNFSNGIGYLTDVTSKYDISNIEAVVAYNYPGNALEKLRKWCLKHGVHIVSDTTEWYAFEGKNLLSAAIRKLSTEYRMRIVNRKIGNIICSTQYIRNYYKKYNTVIVPMIAIDKYTYEKCEIQKPYHFVYAGSPGLNFAKDDIQTIVKAFLSFDQSKYTMTFYGFTEKDFLRRYPEFENDLRKNNSIHMKGRVSRQEVEAAFGEADFYVLYRPDTKVNRVGFSTKSMDAITHGIPLIANDVNGDFQLYFQDNQALISKVDDYDGFVRNIQRAIDMNPEDVLIMKRNCLEFNPFEVGCFIEPMREFIGRIV